jgi:uncharacterized protein YdhG (YjbR/CyaY superfamily)
MSTDPTIPRNIDEYIAAFPPEIQTILEEVRSTIRKAAPDAEEKISYRMPVFALHGNLVYFGAFKNHIGLFPPVCGTKKLQEAASMYAGEKGKLEVPARPTRSLCPDWRNREVQSEGTSRKGRRKAKEAVKLFRGWLVGFPPVVAPRRYACAATRSDAQIASVEQMLDPEIAAQTPTGENRRETRRKI